MRGTSSVPVFCGIDWAEDHYDVALVDDAGAVLARKRIPDDSFGYQLLLELLAEHGDNQDDLTPVAIETPRGLLVACLRRTGRKIYAINPLSVARSVASNTTYIGWLPSIVASPYMRNRPCSTGPSCAVTQAGKASITLTG